MKLILIGLLLITASAWGKGDDVRLSFYPKKLNGLRGSCALRAGREMAMLFDDEYFRRNLKTVARKRGYKRAGIAVRENGKNSGRVYIWVGNPIHPANWKMTFGLSKGKCHYPDFYRVAAQTAVWAEKKPRKRAQVDIVDTSRKLYNVWTAFADLVHALPAARGARLK